MRAGADHDLRSAFRHGRDDCRNFGQGSRAIRIHEQHALALGVYDSAADSETLAEVLWKTNQPDLTRACAEFTDLARGAVTASVVNNDDLECVARCVEVVQRLLERSRQAIILIVRRYHNTEHKIAYR